MISIFRALFEFVASIMDVQSAAIGRMYEWLSSDEENGAGSRIRHGHLVAMSAEDECVFLQQYVLKEQV